MTAVTDEETAAAAEIERLMLEAIRALYARDMQVTGLPELPVAQLRVLNVLAKNIRAEADGERRPTMGELAESLGVTLSTAAQLVERIEKRGLVRREHSDPGDRRVVRLGLTETGRALAAERLRLRRERLAAVLDRLTADQRRLLQEALRPLAEAAAQVAADTRTDAAFLTLLGEVR